MYKMKLVLFFLAVPPLIATRQACTLDQPNASTKIRMGWLSNDTFVKGLDHGGMEWNNRD